MVFEPLALGDGLVDVLVYRTEIGMIFAVEYIALLGEGNMAKCLGWREPVFAVLRQRRHRGPVGVLGDGQMHIVP